MKLKKILNHSIFNQLQYIEFGALSAKRGLNLRYFEFKSVFLAYIFAISLGLFLSCNSVKPIQSNGLSISIPIEGNSWVINDWEKNREVIKKGGIKNWSEKETIIRAYFKTEKAGKLNIGIKALTVSGASKLKITLGNKTETIQINNSTESEIFVGKYKIEEPGYHYIEIQGIERSSSFFPEISAVLLGGEATTGKVWFAKDDYYWGRRGPSVHLNFQVPETAGDIVYYYNEITVPKDNDVLGSYFMANGFAQGYFGMQVNSPDERRILFSVWSPFKTDNPNDIPEDQKIIMLKKGDGVHTGEFGNEGSGGQSYYKYMWKTETTYKFLLKGQPTGNGETDFTAWFIAPEMKQWKIIASFRRPQTDSYLTRFHSFLENFYTETGNVTRKGLYTNQWVCNTKNQWIEVTKMRFTADATARKESRMDYSGGAENKAFFMRNCGFFSDTTPIDSYFEREASGVAPDIEFEELP